MSTDKEVVTTQPAHCTNCEARLVGHYCAHCGQRVEHAVHSLRHFLGEVAEDLTHADSRLWRTMTALLFKPGYLTSEFLAGRRMKYLPPLRLYLVLSLLFFVVAGFNTHAVSLAQIETESNGEVDFKVVPLPALPGESPRQHAERVCAGLNHGVGILRASLRRACRVLYIPYYYYRATRQVYGEGRGRTLGKLTLLGVAYAATAVIVPVATSIYSVLVK